MTAKPMIDMRKLHSELNALAAQQKPCPFCGSDVLRIWFGSPEWGPWSVRCFGGCAVEGPECGTKEKACAAWDAVPRKADIDGRNAVIAELVGAVRFFESYGCPVCHGDCGSANPPVIGCPMQTARSALASAEEALEPGETLGPDDFPEACDAK